MFLTREVALFVMIRRLLSITNYIITKSPA